ncbi:GSCOCG00012271001-RA-CDS [Cotesia congregata]|nr:GSCOCG00012271001-RA-CDS [Cotesia congregata]
MKLAILNKAILFGFDAIRGHKSAHSLATGPVIADPFISPLLLTMTLTLSSKKVPSFLRKGFRWRITTAGITVVVYE